MVAADNEKRLKELVKDFKMQEIVANVNHIRFDVEIAFEQQIGAHPLPFPGMDKSGAAVCTFYSKGNCRQGNSCAFRHVRGDRTVVCKHWLRGLCKKGDQCEFLHEYDMTKMPECYFYSRYNACTNKECPFLHIDPESKVKDCPWYDRGFCRHGPNCRHRHTRRVICINYLCGFCLDGEKCKFVHPRFELPTEQAQKNQKALLCHFCGDLGHKALNCFKMPIELREEQAKLLNEEQNKVVTLPPPPIPQKPFRPLDQVTCYKCGEKGHYANKCPKGHLAFLSSALSNVPNISAPS
ncbi:Cleavage and polyadenylation specificity factor subunit 4 [Nymphon striatum]|nr:Cleavage and polyadenylation specificity factor subunit 4 [Nymphon striatum]